MIWIASLPGTCQSIAAAIDSKPAHLRAIRRLPRRSAQRSVILRDLIDFVRCQLASDIAHLLAEIVVAFA
jgi:hypothetical protein